jgi:hypothetical protein
LAPSTMPHIGAAPVAVCPYLQACPTRAVDALVGNAQPMAELLQCETIPVTPRVIEAMDCNRAASAPCRSESKADFLDRYAKAVRLAQAEKDFEIAEFYRRRGQLASAHFYYEQVRCHYADVPEIHDKAVYRLGQMSVEVQSPPTVSGILGLAGMLAEVPDQLVAPALLPVQKAPAVLPNDEALKPFDARMSSGLKSCGAIEPCPAQPACPESCCDKMNLADVAALAMSKVSDDIILNQMRTTGAVFRIGAEEIIWLKKNGVSDRIVMEMQNSRLQSMEQMNTISDHERTKLLLEQSENLRRLHEGRSGYWIPSRLIDEGISGYIGP